MILALRTDKPDAEVYIYDNGKQRIAHTWHAERQLANQLLGVLRDQLAKVDADFTAITGIVVFQGPGSFTGLRIGITVANSLAYGLEVPVVTTQGNDWLVRGLARLQSGNNDRLALPHYGAEASISKPKK